ncbi:MAG: substrate-binding domain-containing protein, partial [Streptosporangiales bacterium]|nr:substrate-binding domain-containing protein [Streptosporangiales bacterium]
MSSPHGFGVVHREVVMGIRPGTRKSYALAAAGVLALSLVGCGGGDGGGGASGPRKLTLIQGIANEPFYISMYCGAKARAAELGAQLDVQAANEWDVAQQTQIINAVAAKRPDAVMVAPVDKDAMAGPVRQLQGAGSKVIMVDTDLTDQSIGESRISSDNRLGGQLAAQALGDQIGHKGKVMILSPEKGIATTDDRVAGFRDEIKKHPEIEIVSEQYPGDDEGKATSSVTSELSAHQDL